MRLLLLAGIALSSLVCCYANVDKLVYSAETGKKDLLYSTVVQKRGKQFDVVSGKYTYKAKNGASITKMVMTNDYKNGASVWILDGGIGRSSVTFKFLSAPGKGYKFNVAIYGDKDLEETSAPEYAEEIEQNNK